MRATCKVETGGHEYRVQLDSDDSIPVEELIGMAAAGANQMANAAKDRVRKRAKVRSAAEAFAEARR